MVAEAAEQHLKDDVGRKLEMVERCAGALIELAPTKTAAKNGIAQIRGAIQSSLHSSLIRQPQFKIIGVSEKQSTASVI